jgi:hypothetical protein
MSLTDLRAALDARNRADRKDLRIQLAMAIPATLLGVFFGNLLMLPLVYLLSWFGISAGWGVTLLVMNALLATFIVVDIRRHPEESWYRPSYRQVDGSIKGHEFGVGDDPGVMAYVEHHLKGPGFSGMPLMTNMSDPNNLAERGRAISSGFANLILGGPRSIARAMALRRQIADRSSRRSVSSAERFLVWLSGKGVVAEADVKAHLAANPDQAEGLRLARELEVVTRRRIQADFHYHVR